RLGPVAPGAGGGGADGRGRGADPALPGAVAGAAAVADVRQLDLPGPALPAPADADAGAVLPLPQPGREHPQGARAPLGAAGAGRRAQGLGAYRTERRARFDRRTAPLPAAHGGASAAVSGARRAIASPWERPWPRLPPQIRFGHGPVAAEPAPAEKPGIAPRAQTRLSPRSAPRAITRPRPWPSPVSA